MACVILVFAEVVARLLGAFLLHCKLVGLL